LEKYLNTKFYENPSCGSQVVQGGKTVMTMFMVAFRNFVNAPKNNHAGQRVSRLKY